jgi:hypothetical protein
MALAVSAAFLGRHEEAKEAKQRIFETASGSTLTARSKLRVFRDQWMDDRVIEGLRLAGLPEN